MEWEEQGLRSSLVLDSASVLMLTASSLMATVLSSLVELLAQASLSLSLPWRVMLKRTETRLLMQRKAMKTMKTVIVVMMMEGKTKKKAVMQGK
ncbi:unnamed protein product [Brassica napus]|uniref:(rape) hypothetical protein n=1 Tax=Brassica napus TaxID=3708 RepID=A0A816UJ15_BRANA|nr:unnamed protein product [Brassica napus]